MRDSAQRCLEFDNEGAAAGESGPSKARRHLNNVRRLPKKIAPPPLATCTETPVMRAGPPKNACRDLSDTRSRAGIAHQNPTVRVRIQPHASPPNRERGNPKGVCQGRPESGHNPDMLGSGTFAKGALKRKIFG